MKNTFEVTKNLVLLNSLSQQLQFLPFTFFAGKIAHIIDRNEHLKTFENQFYKYILKTAFSQRSKMKTSFVCP